MTWKQADAATAEDQRLQFVKTLFSDGEWLDLRLVKDDGVERHPVSSFNALMELIKKADGAWNVYVGVATRRSGVQGNAAGGAENLEHVRALWVDLDCKAEGDSAAFQSELSLFKHPPSILVDSGGGFHAYWLLEEAYGLQDPEQRKAFEETLRGLADALGGDRAATDPPRTLRVPGTTNILNAKKISEGRKPAPCSLLKLEDTRVFAFDDFADFTERGRALRSRAEPTGYARAAWTGKLPATVDELLQNDGARGSELRNSAWKPKAGGDASEEDWRIAMLLLEASCPPADVEAALRFRRDHFDLPKKHDGYFPYTVEKALGHSLHRERGAVFPQNCSTEDGTEAGFGERLLRLHGEDLRYVPQDELWRVWDGKRYRVDSKSAPRARKLSIQSANSIYHDVAGAKTDSERTESLKQAKRARSRRSAENALWWAAPAVTAEPNGFDADPDLLNLMNGTLDLRTSKLRPHSRTDCISRLAPVEHISDAECPHWNAFLSRVQPDPEVRDYLQRLAGTMLTARSPGTPMHIMWGHGRNGKSVWIETIREILGHEYSVEMSNDAFTMRKQSSAELEKVLVPLHGARLVTSLELSEGQKLYEAAVKRTVSHEPVRVRKLYGQSFETIPCCTVVITTNNRVEVTGDDEGIWRRLVHVDWPVTLEPDECDAHLREKLIANEAAGILNWMLRGYAAWRSEGMKLPAIIEKATQEYRDEQDIVGAFLAERCNVTKKWSDTVPNAALRPAFAEWCDENGHRNIGMNAFADRLKRRGFKRYKRNDTRGWEGFSLRTMDKAS